MRNIFTKHPNSIGESYIEHLIKAVRFCLVLFSLSIKALIHAFLPFLFKDSVSEKGKNACIRALLNNTLQSRKKEVAKDDD